MATCHSITYVDEKLVGDPLEVKMFESTKWKLIEKKTPIKSHKLKSLGYPKLDKQYATATLIYF